MNSKEKIAYSWRVQDVTWTPTEDSLGTVQTLSEHGFFFYRGQFFRTEVGCTETKTDPQTD